MYMFDSNNSLAAVRKIAGNEPHGNLDLYGCGQMHTYDTFMYVVDDDYVRIYTKVLC